MYALVALGYTLVYGILQLINFAHGDVFALSGLFASTWIVSIFHLDEQSAALVVIGGLFVTFLIAMAFGAIINTSIEFLAYRRLRSAPRLAVLITAVGMSFIVQNISLAIYGVNYRSVPPLIPESNVFEFRGVHYSWEALFVVLVTAPVLVLLTWLVRTTRQGDAGDLPGPGGCGDHGHRRQPDDLVHVCTCRRARRDRRSPLPGRVQHALRHRFPARPDRVHSGGARRHRQPDRSRARRDPDRALQAFNEGLPWYAPGPDWTRSIVFGILIAILVFRPEGLLGERTPEGA